MYRVVFQAARAGRLANVAGEVVGINTAIARAQNIGLRSAREPGS